MLKRMLIMLILTALVLGGVFGFGAFKARMIAKFMAAQSNPTQTVSTIVASTEDWRNDLRAVGSLRAVNGADLAGQVSGVVSALHFQSGTDVKQGELLLELTSEDDVAHLEALKANVVIARLNYERSSKLGKTDAVSQQVVDTDRSALLNAEALVAQQQALVDYKSIRAPFSGRLGIRQVDLGQFLPAGTAIVTLQQLDPIYVDFYAPQQALAQIRPGQAMSATVDAFPGRSFPGKVSAIDAAVDAATRMVRVRATLDNKDAALLPGMFVNVAVDLAAPQKYVTLPQTAVAYNSYGDIVYLVDDKGQGPDGKPQLVARQTFVTTGPTRGDQVAILSGVKEGETVVTAGQVKLRNGSPLAVDNKVQPSNDPDPKPVDK